MPHLDTDTIPRVRWKAEPINTNSQRELLKLAQAGDAEAFAQLYDECAERIYRYIYFRVTEEQTAEDLTSQVFYKAWENLDRCKLTGAPFIAWLYTIARNAVIDHYRTRKRTVSLDEAVSLAGDGPAPEEQAELQFKTESLRRALDGLTSEQRRVVVLKFISGLSTDEIAARMGKRAGAVRALQMRALQALAGIMQEEVVV